MNGLAPASAGPVTGPQFDNRRVLAALIDLLLLVPVAVLMLLLFGGFTSAAAALTLAGVDSRPDDGKRVMKLRWRAPTASRSTSAAWPSRPFSARSTPSAPTWSGL
jgi:hypothetical protein